jgi:hypothetical protein
MDNREWILAKNKDTGVVYEIRPDMLKIDGHPWEVLSDTPIEPAEGDDVVTLGKVGEKDIITKTDNTPFKTEAAARSAMKKQGLSDMDHIILGNEESGYIIKQV